MSPSSDRTASSNCSWWLFTITALIRGDAKSLLASLAQNPYLHPTAGNGLNGEWAEQGLQGLLAPFRILEQIGVARPSQRRPDWVVVRHPTLGELRWQFRTGRGGRECFLLMCSGRLVLRCLTGGEQRHLPNDVDWLAGARARTTLRHQVEVALALAAPTSQP